MPGAMLSNPEDRRQIEQRLATLTPDDAALWGKMSVHQMLCHLSDSFRYTLGDRRVTLQTSPLGRHLLKRLALRTSVRWGKGFPTLPEVDPNRAGTQPVDFEQDRADLLVLYNRFCDYLPDPPPQHPFFGPMTAEDWSLWGYRHTDHHLRQFGR